MDLDLTQEQDTLRARVAAFSRREVAPRARDVDRLDAIPPEIWRLFAEQGYPAMPIPKKYGGTGQGLLEQAIMMEEVTAGGHSPVCIALLEAAALFCQVVNIGGTEEQRRRWLPAVASGEINAAFALTEPGVGSDPASMATTATRAGDDYVITGRKRYVSFASISKVVTVFARAPDGIAAIVVETDRPGFRITEKIPCIGLRGHQDEEVELDGVRVPASNRIGPEGQGLKIALSTLERTRTTLCGGFIGLARAALEAALWYGQNRLSFGKPLGEYQAQRFPLAEVEMEINAARLLTWRAAQLDDQGKKHAVETAQAKMAATRAMLHATDAAFTIYGGFGGTQRYVVERFYRDAKIWSYAQGSPEIMTEVVARDLLRRKVEEPLV